MRNLIIFIFVFFVFNNIFAASLSDCDNHKECNFKANCKVLNWWINDMKNMFGQPSDREYNIDIKSSQLSYYELDTLSGRPIIINCNTGSSISCSGILDNERPANRIEGPFNLKINTNTGQFYEEAVLKFHNLGPDPSVHRKEGICSMEIELNN